MGESAVRHVTTQGRNGTSTDLTLGEEASLLLGLRRRLAEKKRRGVGWKAREVMEAVQRMVGAQARNVETDYIVIDDETPGVIVMWEPAAAEEAWFRPDLEIDTPAEPIPRRGPLSILILALGLACALVTGIAIGLHG